MLFATTLVWLLVKKRLPSTFINVQRSMSAQYFTLSSIFSGSQGISKCRYQPSYNLLSGWCFFPWSSITDALCPLHYSPENCSTASDLLLPLPVIPSNISRCYFMQCWLRNAASFKSADWGLDALKRHQATYLDTTSAILQTLKATHNCICCL